MVNRIKVQIYGIYDVPVAIGCTSKTNSCNGCSSHGTHVNDVSDEKSGCEGCNHCITNADSKENSENKGLNTIGKAYENLVAFIKKSDVTDNTELEFIDISKTKLEEDSDIKSLIDRGFESPFTVIDGIVRFYGGLSQASVYKDIKELLS